MIVLRLHLIIPLINRYIYTSSGDKIVDNRGGILVKLVNDMYVTTTAQSKKYYSYLILDDHTYSCHLNSTNDNHYRHNHSQRYQSESYSSSPARSQVQDKESKSTGAEQGVEKEPSLSS